MSPVNTQYSIILSTAAQKFRSEFKQFSYSKSKISQKFLLTASNFNSQNASDIEINDDKNLVSFYITFSAIEVHEISQIIKMTIPDKIIKKSLA